MVFFLGLRLKQLQELVKLAKGEYNKPTQCRGDTIKVEWDVREWSMV